MVRALASHQCGLSLLLVLFLALRGFSPRTPVFLSPWKPTLLNSNSTWNARTRLKDFLKPPKYFVGKQTNKYKLNYKCNFVCFVLCFFACLLFLWLFCTISFFSFQTFVLRKIRDNAADNVSDAFPGIYGHERKQCNVKKTYSPSILTLMLYHDIFLFKVLLLFLLFLVAFGTTFFLLMYNEVCLSSIIESLQ